MLHVAYNLSFIDLSRPFRHPGISSSPSHKLKMGSFSAGLAEQELSQKF